MRLFFRLFNLSLFFLKLTIFVKRAPRGGVIEGGEFDRKEQDEMIKKERKEEHKEVKKQTKEEKKMADKEYKHEKKMAKERRDERKKSADLLEEEYDVSD